ncbi:MAG: hypothetical protein K2W81_00595 [Sphingomonas sp.]|uniref:hypothetical protein n=1 Tax=Sphingomonas sp. TaxID=28214 RepID=UPI002600166F|nr:hypothetical protein [Sphingomonas sp.]MBY0282440.1 hypothetical protein [Sphingomonas sp.]
MSLLFAMLLSGAQIAPPFPIRAGQCGWVHGRFRIANGSSIQRIWIVGTHHVVALYDNDDHYPRSLRRLVDSKQYRPFDSAVFGQFFICARERWITGHLQHVRIRNARNLVMFNR